MKVLDRFGNLREVNSLVADDLSVVWVAERLTQLHRWAGKGIDVGYHTLLVHHVAPPNLKRAALLHDWSEIFIGEIPDPIKQMSPEICAFEEIIQRRIFRIFGVPWADMLKLHPWDKQVGNAEAKVLFPGHDYWRDRPSPENLRPTDLIPISSERTIDWLVGAFYEEFSK